MTIPTELGIWSQVQTESRCTWQMSTEDCVIIVDDKGSWFIGDTRPQARRMTVAEGYASSIEAAKIIAFEIYRIFVKMDEFK